MLGIKESNSVVADRLKVIIEARGLKQTALAAKAGFSPQELSDMMNGRRLMRAADIASIVTVLKDYAVDANTLFGMNSDDIYAAGKKGA